MLEHLVHEGRMVVVLHEAIEVPGVGLWVGR